MSCPKDAWSDLLGEESALSSLQCLFTMSFTGEARILHSTVIFLYEPLFLPMCGSKPLVDSTHPDTAPGQQGDESHTRNKDGVFMKALALRVRNFPESEIMEVKD